MKVVNIKTSNEKGIYIGRKNNSLFHYGNPFSHLKSSIAAVQVKDREAAMQAFDDWLDGIKYQEVEPERRNWILEHLHELEGQNLLCFCNPLPCHGDIYIRRLMKTKKL